ncbi:ski2-like helicase [Planctomycetes bacterium Pla163]|uniref:Ski2-like helicase n=1 Tax=Rohdeia mirabilis TaxID=2528008 RepID=A0A518D1T8_9BACT|nr:ski2-like helicase [Planctomycetes bacterium Pla163]
MSNSKDERDGLGPKDKDSGRSRSRRGSRGRGPRGDESRKGASASGPASVDEAPAPREPVRERERAPRDGADERPRRAADRTGAPTTFKGFTLSAFQLQAVRAIEEGHDVLLSAPTGSGKTLVAEYAIHKSVERGKRCIYTAPIKALSNQKYRDFRDDPDIDVGLMTGDVTIHPGAQVLIMTTEILRNSMLENPDSVKDVEYVIFDEVHYMDDPERGTVWEESLIFAPPSIRFICLSATIDNLGQLGAWIEEIRTHELTIISSTKRPVPLKHRFYLPDVGIFDEHKLPRVRKQVKDAAGRSERGGSRRRATFAERMKRRDDARRNETRGFAVLLDELIADKNTPILVFSFSRKDCERLALVNKHRRLLDREESERMEQLLRATMAGFELDEKQMIGELFQLCLRGIAYHHAGMLPVYKEVVERLFTSGLLKLLFTTETFAVGINMPARTVAFYGLRKFDGETFDYLRTRDYLQMAGRAGRQGIDSEGLVVSRLDEKDLVEAPLERLVRGKPEPVESRFRLSYSAILHLIEGLGRERLFEAWQKSFNQFQHREGGRKARERNAHIQKRFLEGLLGFLHEAGFLEEDDEGREVLAPKARVARQVYGFELQTAEWLWRGVLEEVDAAGLAVLFVGLVFEDRRRFNEERIPQRMYGGVRRHAEQIIGKLAKRESQFSVPVALKQPDWGLTPAVVAWMRGAPFDELQDEVDIPAGDMCRCFRMALQVMRQLRSALDSSYDLPDRLSEAIEALGRDEVDARRQLELG